MNSSITKYTIFEYLSGRATLIEKQTVEDWIKQPENIEYFHEWLCEWEMRSPQFLPDTTVAFQRLVKHLEGVQHESTHEKIVLSPKYSFSFTIKMLAASIAIFMLLGGTWLMKDQIFYKTFNTDYAQMSSFLLEDGSHVSLNANSTLKVPRWGFNKKVREVFLEGEADFSIMHKPDNQRFVVKTSDKFRVEVLGTEFSVFARQRGTKVVLNRGKIRIDYTEGNKNAQLMMKPGDLITLNQQGKLSLQKTEEPQNFSAWKSQKFIFNHTSVEEILNLLDENFGVKLETQNVEISNRTISGTFKAQTADELLQVLFEVLNLKKIHTQQKDILTNK